MAMDEGEGVCATPPTAEFDPLDILANHLKRLRKRPRAPNWVRELCKMLLEKVENWEESFEERCDGDMILEV